MTRHFKMFLLIQFFLFTLTESHAQKTPKEITDKFFSLYEKDPVKAVEYVFSTNKWFDKNQEGVTGLITKLKNTIDLCGEYFGYELLSEKSAGQRIKMMTFVVRYDRQPIRFSIFLYKPNDIWRVNNFSFDESIDDDLKEAVKAYRLKENNTW
jgi:hypothetical protein